MANYPYLNNKAFLKALDEENFKEQFVRITVLDFKSERPLASLEGKSTAGSCNVSGTSNMRRTASCTVAVDFNGIEVAGQSSPQQYNNITEVRNLISMNKKVRIETGFINTLTWEYPDYANYDIIWFPLGTYVIKSANISKNNSGVNISLTLNDKTALLNGDMGGTIPAATVFSESELFNAAGTKSNIEKILIKDIIKYLVVEFGGENPDNVIITDIEDYIVKVMKWKGKGDVYLYTGTGKKELSMDGSKGGTKETFSYGDDVGYMNEPFVYPGTLECSAGETVAAVLDKIKNTLGNFEWFYDLDGRFIFQEVRNYLLSQPNITDISSITSGNYLSTSNYGKSVYTFDKENKKLITSVANNPQYQNIKNDFVVWGTTKTATGADKPIRYHLAFDTKPTITTAGYKCIVYNDYKNLRQAIVLREGETFGYAPNGTSDMTNRKLYYLTKDTGLVAGKTVWGVWHWDDEVERFRRFSDYKVCVVKPTDWRAELYFMGLSASNKSFAKNPYSAELNAELPKFYDIIKTFTESYEVTDGVSVPVYNGGFRDEVKISNYEYWLDFLEGDASSSQSVSQFSVGNIGRRTKVVTDGNSNCIFPIDPPPYVYIHANGDVQEQRAIAASKGQEAIQVNDEIFNNLVLGGSRNAAYDKVRELLYQFTSFNESISLSVVPIYYLEPNTRITVHDNETGVHGDYLIKSISLPLTTNGTSSISATRCLERTF